MAGRLHAAVEPETTGDPVDRENPWGDNDIRSIIGADITSETLALMDDTDIRELQAVIAESDEAAQAAAEADPLVDPATPEEVETPDAEDAEEPETTPEPQAEAPAQPETPPTPEPTPAPAAAPEPLPDPTKDLAPIADLQKVVDGHDEAKAALFAQYNDGDMSDDDFQKQIDDLYGQKQAAERDMATYAQYENDMRERELQEWRSAVQEHQKEAAAVYTEEHEARFRGVLQKLNNDPAYASLTSGQFLKAATAQYQALCEQAGIALDLKAADPPKPAPKEKLDTKPGKPAPAPTLATAPAADMDPSASTDAGQFATLNMLRDGDDSAAFEDALERLEAADPHRFKMYLEQAE